MSASNVPLPGIDPVRLVEALAGHPAALLGGAWLAGMALVGRWWLVRRSLRSRRQLLLTPAGDFDPSIESVERFAAHLARASRSVGGWLDARASSIGVRIDLDEDARLRYRLEAPRRALPALRAAASVYADTQLAEIVAAPPGAPVGAARSRVMRCELVLACPSQHPLGHGGLDPDPLQMVASAMSAVRRDRRESAEIALNLRPLTPAQRGRLRRRLLRRAGRPDRRQVLLRNIFGAPSRTARRDLGEVVQRRSETRALQSKLGSPGPLMQLQLLIRVQSPSPQRARRHMHALLACCDAMAGENYLRVAGGRLTGPWFTTADLPLRRWRFDRRMASGRFAPARNGVVAAAEIAGLLKPPTRYCHAPNVLRDDAVGAPPPPGLPHFAGQRDLIPLGRVGAAHGGHLVGVRVGETVFSYMAGRSRYGKTETAIGQFVHLARNGHGGLFLDPHADAIREIKTYLTDPGLRDRVVEIDLSDLAGRHGQPGWNLFAVAGQAPWQAAQRVEAVVDAFAAALGWDERNTRALNLTTQAAHALTQLARVLPPALAPTIFQIGPLLSNPAWRNAAVGHLRPATRAFFTDRFPRLSPEAITPVTNVVDRLRASAPAAALLGNPTSTFDVRTAMDRGLIVLACPGSGSSLDRLIANFLVYEVLHAARGRTQHPASRRRPFWLFLDELQTYDGPNLPPLLEQSAKYGVRAFLFNQNPERLTTDTLNAVTTNRSHLATTAVNAKAARLLTREWGDEPTPEAITQLARYTYLASITLGDQTSRPFLLHGVRASDLHAQARRPDDVALLDAAIDRATSRRPVQETIEALDRHDEQILVHLTAHRHPKPNGTPGPTATGDEPIALPRLPDTGGRA
jgi:hypothetical protein